MIQKKHEFFLEGEKCPWTCTLETKLASPFNKKITWTFTLGQKYPPLTFPSKEVYFASDVANGCDVTCQLSQNYAVSLWL